MSILLFSRWFVIKIFTCPLMLTFGSMSLNFLLQTFGYFVMIGDVALKPLSEGFY